MPRFEHDTHEATYRQVEDWLPDFFDDPYHDEENGHFYVTYGSTVLEISVEAYGPKESVVKIMSYCAQGVDLSEDLMTTLLELNQVQAFGSFSLVENDVFLSHAIFGRDLQPRGLLSAIAAVAEVADEFDDRLVERFGGQTALERIRDTGGLVQRRMAIGRG